MSKRESGFYWVRVKEAFRSSWEVAEWWQEGETWWIAGEDSDYEDPDMDEIDERRIKRQDMGKKW